jgi:plastocyanin
MSRLVHKVLGAVAACLLAGPLYGESLRVSIMDRRLETGLADAVVEVLPLVDSASQVAPLVSTIDQIDKEFISGVTVVPIGSRISFPNSDDILHHVYSFSKAKTFDIPLYGSDENLDHYELFDKPGVVEIGCNIHDWMVAYIYVAQSDLASKTDSQGVVVLDGLTPGRHRVIIWHARLGGSDPVIREVEITAGMDAELSLSLDLAPERRIRRAPSTTRGRYR